MAHKGIEFLELSLESAGSQYGLSRGSCDHSDEPWKCSQVSYKQTAVGFSRALWSLMLVSVCHDCILQVNMALIHDAVQLFARALRRLDSPTVDIKPLDCESQMNWGHGASLINFMKDVSKMVPSSELQCLTQFALWHFHDSYSYKMHLWSLITIPTTIFITCYHTLVVVLPETKSCDGRKRTDRYCV
jgi:hypothetical protein